MTREEKQRGSRPPPNFPPLVTHPVTRRQPLPLPYQVKINRPVLRIPTLAIHLTKTDERSSFKPNLQNNFYPILATEIKAKLGREAVGKGGNEGGEANAAAAKSGSGVNSGARKERHHSVLLEMLAAELGWVLCLSLSCPPFFRNEALESGSSYVSLHCFDPGPGAPGMPPGRALLWLHIKVKIFSSVFTYS